MRLEDLKTPEDAYIAGFKKIDDITYTAESSEDVSLSFGDICGIFESTYVFQTEKKAEFNIEAASDDVARFTNKSIIGPLNFIKHRKYTTDILADDSFYPDVTRIIMLGSCESPVTVLQREKDLN